MFCTQCGNQVANDARFCAKCGRATTGTASAAPAQPVEWETAVFTVEPIDSFSTYREVKFSNGSEWNKAGKSNQEVMARLAALGWELVNSTRTHGTAMAYHFKRQVHRYNGESFQLLALTVIFLAAAILELKLLL